MNSSWPQSTIVTLRKPCHLGIVEVTVGISVRLGANATEPHFELERPASLQAEEQALKLYPSLDKLCLACEIAVLIGAASLQKEAASKFDYRITIIEGRHLADDCTVGFSLAGRAAVARALGISPDIGHQTYGWTES